MQHHPDITVHVAAIDNGVDEVRGPVFAVCCLRMHVCRSVWIDWLALTDSRRVHIPPPHPTLACVCRQQEGHIVPGIGDAGERLFNVHMPHDDDEASVISNKKPKGGNGNA